MKIKILSLLLVLGYAGYGQNASSGYTQPVGTVLGSQTVINMLYAPTPAYGLGYALVYYPDDYFLPQNANKRYPTFFFCPGNGEHSQVNIIEVLKTSLPQLISQGLKPYGIDPITHDTIKWIVVSQHNPGGGGAYAYPQLQYTIPYMLTGQAGLRIDTSCFWIGGLSGGGRATWSVPMGTTANTDTLIGKRITGIMPMANGGFDGFISVTNMNLDTVARRGLACLYIIGDQDPGWNGLGGMAYNDTMTRYSQPGRYKFRLVAGGTHSENVWNIPFPLSADVWSTGMNAWTLMWTLRKTSAITTLTADAGVDMTITLPTSKVRLSGRGNTPAGTTITSYAWTKISGSSGNVIRTPSSDTTTVDGLVQGSYVFRLTVTNSAGSTASDDVVITVNPATANPPVVSANGPGGIVLPTSSAALSGSAIPQGSNTIVGYLWTQISGPNTATIVTPASINTSVTGLIQGAYSFNFKGTDNLNQSANAQVTLIVNAAGAGGGNVVAEIACSEYAAAFRYRKDSLVRKFTFNGVSGHVQFDPYIIGGRKAIAIAPLFNTFLILDDQHYVWRTLSGNSNTAQGNDNTFRVDVDTLGNPFNDVQSIYGYYFTAFSIRSDGTIWQCAGDDYKFVFGSNPSYDLKKPVKINQPAGVNFVKLICGRTLIGIAANGDAYMWVAGSSAYTKLNLPGPCIGGGSSQRDWVCLVVNDYGGGSGMGNPYVFGSEYQYWGGNVAISPASPLAVKALWGLTKPIKELVSSNNTIHFIDSVGDLYGIGDNPNGEIGIGTELVNKFDVYPTPLAWSWAGNEAQVHAPPQRVFLHNVDGSINNTKLKHLYGGSAFVFYKYAQDMNDSVYFWGRNKSFVGGDGVSNGDEAVHPNALDVLTPTMRTPINISPTQTQIYQLSFPTCNAGADQVVNSTSATLAATATPTILAATGKPNYGYTIVGYAWVKISGPACTIVSPNSASTLVNGMSAGVYQFKVIVTDNNTATWADTVKVTITTAIPSVNVGPDQSIALPTNAVNLTGSAVANGGATLANLLWTKTSGPSSYTISLPGSVNTGVSGLVAGTYVFTLTATDSNGNTGSASVTITVVALPSIPTRLIFHKFFKKVVR
jgi:hypothetical protein